MQFKFSRQIPPAKIGEQELSTILTRLLESARRAKNLGQQIIGYALISNRELGPTAIDMRQKVLEASSIRKDTKNSILRSLQIIPPIAKATWETSLKAFACTYGCVDRDIRIGIGERIGNIILQTVEHGSPSLTQADLVNAFTGFSGAQPMTPERVARESKKQLDDFFLHHHLSEKQTLVRRATLDAISRCAEEHALVVVSGLGGSGKTVALWHWVNEFLSHNSPQQKGTYAAILSIQDVQVDCLTHLFCDWAHLPSHHAWRAENMPEHILERLQAASPKAGSPIFYLNLDALDEERELLERSRQAIKQLLRWFWKEECTVREARRRPKATLILTCRNAEEVADDWLHLYSPFDDMPGLDNMPERLPIVRIADFSDSELGEAAQLGVAKEIASRIEKALYAAQSISFAPEEKDTMLLPQEIDPFLQPVDARILQALHHPALWQCLLSLPEISLQSAVLDGDTEAMHLLTHKFLSWFCMKARVRGIGYALKRDELQNIITTIAQKCREQKKNHFSRVQWIEAACSTNLIAIPVAERLYNEALSAGLIERIDLDTWRWRHLFLGDYLGVPLGQKRGQ